MPIYIRSNKTVLDAVGEVVFTNNKNLSVIKIGMKALQIKPRAFYRQVLKNKKVFSQSDEQGFAMLGDLKNVKPGTAAD